MFSPEGRAALVTSAGCGFARVLALGLAGGVHPGRAGQQEQLQGRPVEARQKAPADQECRQGLCGAVGVLVIFGLGWLITAAD